jgi:hypothetical protein
MQHQQVVFNRDVEPHEHLVIDVDEELWDLEEENALLPSQWQMEVAEGWACDPRPLSCEWACHVGAEPSSPVHYEGKERILADGFGVLALPPLKLEAVVQYPPLVNNLLRFQKGLAGHALSMDFLSCLAKVRRGCIEVQGGTLLVPVIACATPSLPSQCSITYSVHANKVLVRAGPGGGEVRSPVTLGYGGGQDNACLFMRFGVVVADNTYEEYRIEGLQNALKEAGVRLLRGLPKGAEDEVLLLRSAAALGPIWPGIPGDACDLGTLCALRWMLCGEEELTARIAAADGCSGPACMRDPLPHEAEMHVWTTLVTLCNRELRRLPTTLEEDESVLALRGWAPGTAAAVMLRVEKKRLLRDSAARIQSCIMRGLPTLEIQPTGAFDLPSECAKMPAIVRDLMLGETRPEDTNPNALLRALRLGEDQYLLAKRGAFMIPRQVVRAVGVLDPQECAELMTRVDRSRQILADSVDGAPGLNSLSSLALIALVTRITRIPRMRRHTHRHTHTYTHTHTHTHTQQRPPAGAVARRSSCDRWGRGRGPNMGARQ